MEQEGLHVPCCTALQCSAQSAAKQAGGVINDFMQMPMTEEQGFPQDICCRFTTKRSYIKRICIQDILTYNYYILIIVTVGISYNYYM